MRTLDTPDWPAVKQALQRLESFQQQYPFRVTPDHEGAFQHILAKAENGDAFVVGNCLLLVSGFQPWYGFEQILQEELIMAIGPHPNVRAAILGFERIGRERRCDYLLAGNTLQDPRLSNIYRRLGYTHASDIFTKELKWEKS
jgi:hypothetical protein